VTQLEVAAMDAVAARIIIDRIKTGVDVMWELITTAYEGRAWEALGYSSWDDLCTREFGSGRLRLPREERAEVVASLRESGLSIRAIAAATGDSIGTVHDAIASGVQNRTPDPEPVDADEKLPPSTTGLDGKNYPRKEPAPPKPARRKPLPEAFGSAIYELKRSVERVTRLMADDRFTKNTDQITECNLSDLIRIQDAINGIVQQLEG
jgi:hypothetical protein